ncbi:rho GTPase-activating protein 30 [Hemicordylus capensis]|uniref:rho GTPase-activating protein 30 n=1 Tax=Hemicordylus capensis TaxID=884348 RepID=UPI00230433CB|nr:rho GTPase-activating protein 30 [Hemicordylus capensis]
MSLAMKARKAKRKGAAKDRVFGCDLVEHLQLSGLEVPQVLKSCTDFVEHHGIVDGIYRLSGVSSNIQKLRQEFDSERNPELNRDVYLQDIHCVSSLCKAYFRELPNPLLTYQLYDKFADAVAIQMEEGRLVKIKEVLKELPSPHYRTLEFLMRHLVHMASYSPQTNMHVRNLAIVWAPNLLRSKDIEASGFNGTAAFMEVRIQSIVVEFILTHVEQLFGDAPLCGATRESIRKSLLLMGSPAALLDEKYCFSYNVPAMLNQGDGPPQMRPYHTIIELNDSKRKGSLKAKKWRSIFNLGRSGNDSKRKSNKEDKDDKVSKMRLRPAKSMDSLSSVPCISDVCISDDEPHLGRKMSQKQLLLCRESFDGPASLDSSFLESDEYPEKIKAEERQGESEGEATAKSEPTTPKPSRSSITGVAPPGRSPKTGRSRAEKCVGVHISGPFSVTVPFHITSNLTLSRLTRGLECPALNHCTLEKEMAERGADAKEEGEVSKQEEGVSDPMATNKEDPTEADASLEYLLDLEKNQMSMEVQDSFSFLDSQDAWLGESLDCDQPWKNHHPDPSGGEVDGFPFPEDEMGSGFMNEMIGGGMQLEMPSGLPPLAYLSIEECMNEQSDEEDDQYYLATGCLEVDAPKEVDSEEVFVSAFDDLSPLATELRHLSELDDLPPPPSILEDQPFSLAIGFSSGGPSVSHQWQASPEPLPGSLSAHDPGFADSSLDPDFTNPSEEEERVSLSSGSLEKVLEDDAKITDLPWIEDADVGGRDPNPQVGSLLHEECPGDGVPEENHRRSLDLEGEKHSTQPSPERQPHAWSASETEQGLWPPCDSSLDADGLTLEVAGICDENVGWGLPIQEADQLQSGKDDHQPPPAEAPSTQRDPTLLGADLEVSPLLGRSSEAAFCEDFLVPPPLLGVSSGPPDLPWPESGLESDGWSLPGSPPQSCPASPLQKPPRAPVAKAPGASKHSISDGSVHMQLASSTTRIQQARSFPVVPPKPQFAKIPPCLTPKTPTEEASVSWPDPPALEENCGNGTQEGLDEGSARRAPHPVVLDTCRGAAESNEPAAVLPAPSETPASPDSCGCNPDVLQKQRNSMPVSLERYGRDGDGRGDAAPKPPCSPRDKYGPRSKSTDFSGDYLRYVKSFSPESFDQGGGSRLKSGEGNGESPQKPDRHSTESSGAAPAKQRRSSWRNGGSMSFDEAVALAKERQASQVPMRRMQTYCCGDAEVPRSPPRAEKPPPHPKPALKPLGHRLLRPLSCIGPAASPETLVSGNPLRAQASSEAGRDGQLPPSQEMASFPHDPPPRSRLSLPKIGRRLSLSEELSGLVPQEQR